VIFRAAAPLADDEDGLPVSADLHLRHEAKSLAVKRLDEALRLAVIAQGLSRRLDPAGDGRIGDDASVPHLLDDLVPGDQPLAVLDQVEQYPKRFVRKMNRLASRTAQAAFVRIEFKLSELV